MNAPSQILFLFIIMSFSFISTVHASDFVDYPSVHFPDSWKNNPSAINYWKFSDNTSVRTVLALGKNGFPDLCFGFFNNGTANTFHLAILKVPNKVDSSFSTFSYPPVVLWTANRDKPVQENSTLLFTVAGLVLQDVDCSIPWSGVVKPGSKPVRMELTGNGNLKVLSSENGTLWESFQSPTNTWVPGQTLFPDSQIRSSISNYEFAPGLFYLELKNNCMRCYVSSNPSQVYCHLLNSRFHNIYPFGIGSFLRVNGNGISYQANYPSDQDFQYTRLESNGSLNVYVFADGYKETFYFDLLNDQLHDACSYPMVCGKYGICNDTDCACPSFFSPSNASKSNSGCQVNNELNCRDAKNHGFLELLDVDYFGYKRTISGVDVQTCKETCLKNCSCKGVVFRYDGDRSKGDCFLPRDIFSLKVMVKEDKGRDYNGVITYLKVEMLAGVINMKNHFSVLVLIFLVSIGIFILLLGAGYFFYFIWRKKHPSIMDSEEERSAVHVPPVIRKFSFEDLRTVADDFRTPLGKGGYGEVFEGTLQDGTKVAVKRLFGNAETDFLPEIETIGRVHHFNLVRLIGYCAEGSNRLLVYEHVKKGSLDKWTFKNKTNQMSTSLGWNIKWQIILEIAKGLEYLHEHCNPKIIHFDIKPQNILPDEAFHIKIADFRLAKWIDRDQSNVLTRAKGKRGYMAPELMAGRNVSVKVDVYSFGIVILEIVCGRKNSDMYDDDEYLIDEVRTKAQEGRLNDLIIDEQGRDREEARRDMEIAIRCLQHHKIRPSMPVVVKLLEGTIDVEPIFDYDFLTIYVDPVSPKMMKCSSSTPLMDSVLSGPR